MKKYINKNTLYKIINESIKKCLNETTFYGDTHILNQLNKLVYKFTLKEIDFSSEYEINDIQEFIDGLIELYQMSEEYVYFKRNNLFQLYKKYEANNNVDGFYNEDFYLKFSYIDDYLNDYKVWEKYMPSPEELKHMVDEFFAWYKGYCAEKIEKYANNIWSEYRSQLKQINKNIY